MAPITAFEIFSNPHDLEIVIQKVKGENKFCIGIFRGPEHRFKTLLTSSPTEQTLEEAVQIVKEHLESAVAFATKSLADPESLFAHILKCDGERLDESRVLNSKLIEEIVEDLLKHQEARTWKKSETKSQ